VELLFGGGKEQPNEMKRLFFTNWIPIFF